MASPSKLPSTAALVLLALVAAAAILASPTASSTVTVFTGPGCTGQTKDVNNVCGCYDISNYQAGIHFVFAQGQQAYVYGTQGCTGQPALQLNNEKRQCTRTYYKSVRMIC